MRILMAIGLSMLMPACASAADADWREVTPRLEGCWSGSGMGGQVSECWLVAEDGRADGMFLIRRDGSPSLAEIIAIDDFGEGVEMRLKHVNPDMTGWEEKDDYVSFRFIRAETDALIFRGLTLNFDGSDRIRTELQMTFGDGDPQTVPFDFARTASLTRTEGD